MTILSRIRSRVGLLVGIIFLALLAFVLTDLFNSQRGIFSSAAGASDVGAINGHTISVTEFRNKMDEVSGGKNLSEQEQSQLADGIWQEMVDKYVFTPQYEALGITVTTDELSEAMYADHPSQFMNQFFQDRQTGQIYEQFRGPDGQLSGKAIRDYVKKMKPEEEGQWALVETDMAKFLLRDKYNNLLRKGFYVTAAEARHSYTDENTKYNFKYIVKKYTDVPDSTLKVSDEEMMDYYKNNPWKFKQRENMRNIEYLAFDIYPSADDIANQRKSMEALVTEFKGKSGDADSLFAIANDESGNFNKTKLHPGQFPVGSDSAFIKAAKGDVLGPFNEGENIAIYKKTGQFSSVDSVKIRHLLVAYKGAERAGPDITRTKEQSKQRADSLLKVFKSGKKKMEDLVETFTDDPGSKGGNKGDYGWFSQESGFVKEFKDAGFNNPKGALVVIETSFGYHVIQVLDKSTESTKVEVIAVKKKVEPSENTIRDIYNKASEFAGRNNTGELFTKAIVKDGKQVLKAENITEGAKSVQGIDNPREIIRWMYDENTVVGSISQPFQNGDRYIICHLTKIVNKGTKPFELDEVREICEVEAKKIKKGKMLADELLKSKANSLDAWSANSKLSVMSGAGVALAQPYIQGAGLEGVPVGTLASMKQGQLSAPVVGTNGVYVLLLESVTKPEPLKDVEAQRTKVLQGLAGRADASSSEILMDDANITDNRAKHF